MCLFSTDGWITFIMCDNRLVTGPFVKEVSLQEELEFEKGERHAS